MDLVVQTHRAPNGGETLSGKSFVTIPGGKGANQAVAVSRMGGNAILVGRVGQDIYSDVILENLEKFNVDTNRIRREEKYSTGVASIIVEENGENRIIIVSGANGCVNESDVDSAIDILREAYLLVMQYEINVDIVLYAAKTAFQLGVPILLNPAPAYPIGDEILKLISYLILNEHEAEMISGIKIYDLVSAEIAAQNLHSRGVSVVIITLGENGLVMVNGIQTFSMPAHTVNVVDSTAAGDTFIGAFATAMQKNGNLLEAIRFANAAGALTVTRFGAQQSIPSYDEVLMFLKNECQASKNFTI